MITLPEELYTSELIDIVSTIDEEDEDITLSVWLPSRYKHETEDVADIHFWLKKNTYYIDRYDYNLKDEVGNEMVNNEIKEILGNIKNYLDILGFKDITQDEY